MTSEFEASQLSLASLPAVPGPYWVPPAKSVSSLAYLSRVVAGDMKAVDPRTPSQAELAKVGSGVAGAMHRLKWMLEETMGAAGEDERRRRELATISGSPVGDEEVVQSFIESVSAPDGFMV